MENSRKSSSSDLIERVAHTLAPVIPAGSSILLGLSGGVDSVVLLHLLQQLSPRYSWRLCALHVHHGISPRADAWAAFCADLCARYDIPLQVEHVNIAPLRELGVEAAARKLRHAALARQPVDFVALAHHLDDQVETLLLQMLRGAGVKGVAAMPFVKRTAHTPSPLAGEGWGEGANIDLSPSDETTSHSTRPSRSDGQVAGYPQPSPVQGERVRSSSVLLRPLLDVARSELLAYAGQHGLQWVEDESNADDAYPRNFLRHRILPLLEQRFPSYRATLARSARHFAEAGELLDQLAQQDAQDSPPRPLGERVGERGDGDDPCLEVSRLQSLNQSRAKNLLRFFIAQQGAPMPESSRLEEMLRQLCHARSDASVCITFGGWQAGRYRGRVYVFPVLPECGAEFCAQWRGEERLKLPELGGTLYFESSAGQGLSREKLQQAAVTVRVRRGAERMRLDRKRPARTLKNLFQEHGIPPWQRDKLPLLFCGETLAAIPGIGVECGFQAAPEEAGVQLRWEWLHGCEHS